MKFQSCAESLFAMPTPEATNLRIVLMPIVLGDMASVPTISHDGKINAQWRLLISRLFAAVDWASSYRVGFLSIEELAVKPCGMPTELGLQMFGLPGHPKRLLLSSKPVGSAWNQTFHADPTPRCDHLRDLCRERYRVDLRANVVYEILPTTVHEWAVNTTPEPWQIVTLVDYTTLVFQDNWTPNPLGVEHPGVKVNLPAAPTQTSDVQIPQ